MVLFVLELSILLAFAVTAVWRTYQGNAPDGSMQPQWNWFNPFVTDAGGLADGALLALFMYWGWDTTLAMNEETRGRARTPGRAATIATSVLVLLYLFLTVSAQSFAGIGDTGIGLRNAHNQDDILAVLGQAVFGEGYLSHLLIFVILASTVASAQATILPAARLALSMSSHRALPRRFSTIHPRYLTPSAATLAVGLISSAVYLVLLIASADVLADSINAISILIAFYYALTGFACAWLFRAFRLQSLLSFLLRCVIPLSGGLMLTAALMISIPRLADPGVSHTAWAGIGGPLVIAAVACLAGLVAMIACNIAMKRKS